MRFIEANLRLHRAAANSPPAIHCISYHKWPTVFTKKRLLVTYFLPYVSFLVTRSISCFILNHFYFYASFSICSVVTFYSLSLPTSSPSPSSSPTSTDPGMAQSLSHSLTSSRAAAAAAVARGGRGLWLWLAMVVVLAGKQSVVLILK